MKFEVFIPGIFKNYSNSRVDWWIESKYTKVWRSRVQSYMLNELGKGDYVMEPHAITERRAGGRSIPDTFPKIVKLHITTTVRFDEEGLFKATKPIVDALMWGKKSKNRRTGMLVTLPGVPIINDDGPTYVGPYDDPSMHTIIRSQQAGRPAKATPWIDPRGVRLTICLKEEPDADAT